MFQNKTKTYTGLNAKKRLGTHNTTINMKQSKRIYLRYKQATDLLKLTHEIKNNY